MKGKFGLGPFFRPGKQELQVRISTTLRKYFALPLLKPCHIREQVGNLEAELKSHSRFCTKEVARKLNRFHVYFVDYWMKLQGCETISVVGMAHKTNNIVERFHRKLNSELPVHASLFRFMACLRNTVITGGNSSANQAATGTSKPRPVDKARDLLLKKAAEVERAYLAGEIGAKEVLIQGACHYQNEKILAVLHNLSDSEVSEAAVRPVEQGVEPDVDVLPDIDADLDEREAILQDDPDLRDVDEEVIAQFIQRKKIS